jgi:hypothetical protein
MAALSWEALCCYINTPVLIIHINPLPRLGDYLLCSKLPHQMASGLAVPTFDS